MKKNIDKCFTIWKQQDVVIWTLTVGVGVDFSELHFDFIFAWTTNMSTSGSFFMQQINHVSSNQVFFHLQYTNGRQLPEELTAIVKDIGENYHLLKDYERNDIPAELDISFASLFERETNLTPLPHRFLQSLSDEQSWSQSLAQQLLGRNSKSDESETNVWEVAARDVFKREMELSFVTWRVGFGPTAIGCWQCDNRSTERRKNDRDQRTVERDQRKLQEEENRCYCQHWTSWRIGCGGCKSTPGTSTTSSRKWNSWFTESTLPATTLIWTHSRVCLSVLERVKNGHPWWTRIPRRSMKTFFFLKTFSKHHNSWSMTCDLMHGLQIHTGE